MPHHPEREKGKENPCSLIRQARSWRRPIAVFFSLAILSPFVCSAPIGSTPSYLHAVLIFFVSAPAALPTPSSAHEWHGVVAVEFGDDDDDDGDADDDALMVMSLPLPPPPPKQKCCTAPSLSTY